MALERQEKTGFSLIELLITIAVLGVLTTLALPSFSNMLKNNRLTAETNDLMSDLAFARMEAARRGKRVTICLSSDGASCGTGAVWQSGRIVFADTGTYGVVGTGDEVLRVNQSSASKVKITAAGFSIAGTSTLSYLQFRSSGAISSDSGGTFTICDDRSGNYGRTVSVLSTGRVSLTSTSASCS